MKRTEKQNIKMKEIQTMFNDNNVSEGIRKKILRGAKQRYRRRNWSSEMKTWRRRKKRYRKWIVKLEMNFTEEEIDQIMQTWEENNPNPANVVALVGIGKWMPAANCPLKGYPKTSFGRLHKAIDQHPRTMQRVGLMVVHESCTSKVCSCCGGIHENLEIRNKEGTKKEIHHVTHCKSVKDQENGKHCEMSGFYKNTIYFEVKRGGMSFIDAS